MGIWRKNIAVCGTLVLCAHSAKAQVTFEPPTTPSPARRYDIGPAGNSPQDALNRLIAGDHISIILAAGDTPGQPVGTVVGAIATDAECASAKLWYSIGTEVCVQLMTSSYVGTQKQTLLDAALGAIKDVHEDLAAKIDAQSKTIDLLQKRIEVLEKSRPRH